MPSMCPPLRGELRSAAAIDPPVRAPPKLWEVGHNSRPEPQRSHRKETIMSANVALHFAAVNLGCADPAALGEFWGKVLGREVTPGVTAPEVVTVGTTDPGGRPQMVFYPAPEAERVIGGFVPTLQTEHHDEEV